MALLTLSARELIIGNVLGKVEEARYQLGLARYINVVFTIIFFFPVELFGGANAI